MRHLTMLAIAATCLGLVACDNKQTDQKQTDPAATAAATAANTITAATATAAPTPTPVTIADTDIVTPADLEEDAEKAITKKNYKTELASLESEMSKE
jgi:hypothetical protein